MEEGIRRMKRRNFLAGLIALPSLALVGKSRSPAPTPKLEKVGTASTIFFKDGDTITFYGTDDTIHYLRVNETGELITWTKCSLSAATDDVGV